LEGGNGGLELDIRPVWAFASDPSTRYDHFPLCNYSLAAFLAAYLSREGGCKVIWHYRSNRQRACRAQGIRSGKCLSALQPWRLAGASRSIPPKPHVLDPWFTASGWPRLLPLTRKYFQVPWRPANPDFPLISAPPTVIPCCPADRLCGLLLLIHPHLRGHN
jgi:hypothetical protein